MTDPKMIADRYLAAWNEDAGEARRTLLVQGWAGDAHYVDPMMSATSREGIATMIEGARAQFPGHAFTLAGTPDGHGDHVRFSWTLAPEGGAPVARGTDVVRLDAEDRIARVIGFLDGAAA